MARNGGNRLDSEVMRPLTKHEIDRRISHLLTEVAGLEKPDDGEESPESISLRPRRISPEELVRRMRPFLVYN